jgi:hypothetical protein
MYNKKRTPEEDKELSRLIMMINELQKNIEFLGMKPEDARKHAELMYNKKRTPEEDKELSRLIMIKNKLQKESAKNSRIKPINAETFLKLMHRERTPEEVGEEFRRSLFVIIDEDGCAITTQR